MWKQTFRPWWAGLSINIPRSGSRCCRLWRMIRNLKICWLTGWADSARTPAWIKRAVFSRRVREVLAGLAGARCAVCGALLGAGYVRDCLLCSVCRRELAPRTGGYCPRCAELFEDSSAPAYLCGDCRRRLPPWDGIGFFGPYRGVLKEMIH